MIVTEVNRAKVLGDLRARVLVVESGCWEWQGYRTYKGYGRLRVAGRDAGTHRVAYEAYVGAIPPGLLVCHRCDNPSCCNPEHLFLGTTRDNLRDAAAKGRLGPDSRLERGAEIMRHVLHNRQRKEARQLPR